MAGAALDYDQYSSLHQRIEAAAKRIAGHVRRTPLEYSPWLTDLCKDANVFIKLESDQVTGSFKARGAYNKLSILKGDPLLSLSKTPPVMSSSGNHGLACGWAMDHLGVHGELYVPNGVSLAKLEGLRRSSTLDVKFHGTDCVETELHARHVAMESGRPFVSPYNDIDIVAGQGTIGKEILEDLPDVDVVLVAVGGGGLISGIAAYMKVAKPTVLVVGCQPEVSAVMCKSVAAGYIVDIPYVDTLSDGTAGGVEKGTITFNICRDCVDEWILVSEDMIARAMYFMLDHHHKVVEGAVGVTVGAFMQEAGRFAGKTVVLLSSGSNVSMAIIKRIINSQSTQTRGEASV